MTQKEKVLEMLRSKEWVSSVDFVNAYMLRAQARVFDLRREGYEIESRKVEGKSYDEYRLIRDKVVELQYEEVPVAEESQLKQMALPSL